VLLKKGDAQTRSASGFDTQDRREPSIQLDKEHAIAVRKPDAPVRSPAQYNHLVSERSIFGFKPAL
jgi:hypothetical protein